MFQNRIVGHGEESPDQLMANPFNWRIHPFYQQEALQDVLDEVGWVKHVVVNKTTGHIVDGHLRVMQALKQKEATIPVKYVELNEQEELEILATFDPIKELADKHEKRALALAERVKTRSEALRQLVDNLRPPQSVTHQEAKAIIAKEHPQNTNAVFALGEFRITLPQAELSAWWEKVLAQHEGNRQKAVADILNRLGVHLEAEADEQPVA